LLTLENENGKLVPNHILSETSRGINSYKIYWSFLGKCLDSRENLFLKITQSL